MKLQAAMDGWVVTLSRRNLKELLAKLDGHPACSEVTIFKDFPIETTTVRLYVSAEEDEQHYGEATPVHPEAEAPRRRHPWPPPSRGQ